ncbi:MAG: hypothetical protein HY738_10550 [Bacteroidia bacterium]|nr:hypothetical protein [Bacteroidia bacterium]
MKKTSKKISKKDNIWHWSVDVEQLKKHKEAYTIWKLEHLINYGLQGQKLDEKLVKKYWDKLFLDPFYKKYLQFLLLNKVS